MSERASVGRRRPAPRLSSKAFLQVRAGVGSDEAVWHQPASGMCVGEAIEIGLSISIAGAGCLNAHCFLSLEDAKRKIEAWRRYYNEVRPHSDRLQISGCKLISPKVSVPSVTTF